MGVKMKILMQHFLLKNRNFKLIASSVSHILVLDTWICLHIAARLSGIVVRLASAAETPRLPGPRTVGRNCRTTVWLEHGCTPVRRDPCSQDLSPHCTVAAFRAPSCLSARPSASGWWWSLRWDRLIPWVPWPAAVLGGRPCCRRCFLWAHGWWWWNKRSRQGQADSTSTRHVYSCGAASLPPPDGRHLM